MITIRKDIEDFAGSFVFFIQDDTEPIFTVAMPLRGTIINREQADYVHQMLRTAFHSLAECKRKYEKGEGQA